MMRKTTRRSASFKFAEDPGVVACAAKVVLPASRLSIQIIAAAAAAVRIIIVLAAAVAEVEAKSLAKKKLVLFLQRKFKR